MAKRTTEPKRKSLVIVESPAKARTIGKFLGPNFAVEASIGHIRDLPKGEKELPEKYKGEEWAYLGVDVNDGFRPVYIIPAGKKKQVAKLRSALQSASNLYLATDEDREGEAISWHLCEVLKPRVPVHRLVFHEITEEAIAEAMSHPRQIDDALVRAQEARRILDRLYGFDVSKLLWKKVGRGLSAGRVQSVAVRLIVERERERIAFRSATYWDLEGVFATAGGEEFRAAMMWLNGRRLPTGKDFDPSTGKLRDPSQLLLGESEARELAERLQRARFQVTGVERKPYTAQPPPPFTTSTMQQEANRKLGFTARRTMTAAQSLYENGHITYMRTDSTSLARVAVEAARELVRTEYGEEYLPKAPRVYQSTVKNAQEAHEAIRPAGHPFELPEVLKSQLGSDEYRLFELIWRRTIASQMEDARGHRTTISLEGDGAVFRVSGRTIDFPGFLRAYAEDADGSSGEWSDKDAILPAVEPGQPLRCQALSPCQHTTQPPARYTEASLTRRLEEMGIGRPSTYATIIETIQARDYVFKRGNTLVPTWTAFVVTRLLEEHLASLVDYQFTAQMEDYLDAISRREAEHIEYLKRFYFGNGSPGLKRQLAAKAKEIDPRSTSRFLIGTPEGSTEPIHVRVGKYGPFLEQGTVKTGIPEDLPPDELTLERAVELLARGGREGELLGHCPQTGKPVYLKTGRFGPYVQLGAGGDEKPKSASLLKGMEPSGVTLDIALQLLALPRELGQHPESGRPIVVHNGRFGPYVKCGEETRSLPAELSPLDITAAQAVELLARPRSAGRGRGGAREPLKVLDASPITGQPIRLLSGRYGPYVTDGQTNASLPKDASPEEITHARAVELLAERAAKGSIRKRAPRRASSAAKARPPAARKGAAKGLGARKKRA